MKLYKTLDLRKSEMEKIYQSLGGQYSFWERLRMGGIGSPMLYYTSGNEQLDQLQALATDELRINLELLKEGVLFRIAERTTTYFIPFLKTDILRITLSKDTQKTRLRLEAKEGLLFHLWAFSNEFTPLEFFFSKYEV